MTDASLNVLLADDATVASVVNQRRERTPGPLRVLTLNDGDSDRGRIDRLLSPTGLPLEIVEAGSGSDAIAQLQSADFDCAIVDHRLADADLIGCVQALCPLVVIVGAEPSLKTPDAAPLADAVEAGLRAARAADSLQDIQHHLSLHDGLTGLATRGLFLDRLEQASLAVARGGPPCAVLMMDLDQFKEVNDTLGHAAGDKVLAEIGQRLRAIARRTDSFARLGGDEFAGLLVGTDSVAGAAVMAERIVAAIREPFAFGGEMASVGVSIGIALIPDHASDGQEVLAKADRAMYQAKRSGRDYQCFLGDDERARSGPALAATYLTEALGRNELFLHFQPMINLTSGALSGVEALARWHSPQFGWVPPADFIPVAERSAMIGTLTYAVLDMVLAQAKLWRNQGWRVPVSVNLSARMLDDPGLVGRVADALAEHDLPAEMLTLEITETALMVSPARAHAVLRELKRAGVVISIDDFGSGYTSLKYLREFDISEIKIDGIFVRELTVGSRDASIIRSLSTLARGFDINLVAECVEREESWKFLRELGCSVGQGYSIARPMTAQDLPGWWQSWQAMAFPSPCARPSPALARLATELR
jgi:diguanylate cyclase (GGDEF)-like protein